MANINRAEEVKKKQLDELNSVIIKLTSSLDKLIINDEISFKLPDSISSNIPMSFKDNLNDYASKIKDLLKNNEMEIFTTDYLNNLEQNIKDLIDLKELALEQVDIKEFNSKTKDILSQLNIIYVEFRKYLTLKNEFKQLSFDAISESLTEINIELSAYRRLKGIVENALTENIYNNATKKYEALAKGYRHYFYFCIIGLLTISILILMISLKPYLGFGVVEFWLIKLSIVIIGVMLINYYLKQSTHYQKLADQNYQVQVELQAYPSFMSSIPSNEAAAIRKELALKYFGKEIDSTPHKDMSNLISDQMKNSTELVKAATDTIKILKSKGSI